MQIRLYRGERRKAKGERRKAGTARSKLPGPDGKLVFGFSAIQPAVNSPESGSREELASKIPMSELKFACPECKQRIAVEENAAGVPIDCPTCRSSLVIPTRPGEIARMITRRR